LQPGPIASPAAGVELDSATDVHLTDAGSAKPKVLVIDDDPASLELVETVLKAEGFHVDTASDGNLALSMTGANEYGLVVVDFHMPVYSGAEVLKLIRRQHPGHKVAILAVTGDDSARTREALKQSGVDGVLTKPVDLEALRNEVSRLVSTP
jgi:DNA-binding response OmpR family regulator